MSGTVGTRSPAPGSPVAIRAMAQGWRQIARHLQVVEADVQLRRRFVPQIWRDAPGAQALSVALDGAACPLLALSDELTAVATLLEDYADALERFQERERSLDADLTAVQARVDRDATALRSTWSPLPHTSLPELTATVIDLQLAERTLDATARARSTLAADAQAAATRTAAQVRAAASALQAIVLGGGIGLDSSPAYSEYLDALAARRPPALPGDPAAAAAAWSAFDPELRRRYLARYPAALGNAAGLPAGDRDTANRLALQGDLEDLHRRVAAAGYVLAPDEDPLGAHARTVLLAAGYEGAALTTAQSVLATSRALRRAQAAAGPGVQLLIFEPGAFGGKGRAAIALGDVRTADRVAVLAPGMTSEVPGYLDVQVDNAAALLAARRASGAAHGADAVVAYVGYDAPGATDPAVVLPGKAIAGGAVLARDLTALRTMHDGSGLRLTLIAHSYGSTTAAYAVISDHAPVDNLVLIGSPGAGPARSAADFGLPGHVFVGAASGDPVTTEVQQEGDPDQAGQLPIRMGEHLGGFLGGTVIALTPLAVALTGFRGFSLGRDPAGAPFGATRFHAETSSKNTWQFDNHSEYFRPGSESLENLAAIMGDDIDRVGVAPGRPESSGHYEGVDPEVGHVPPPR